MISDREGRLINRLEFLLCFVLSAVRAGAVEESFKKGVLKIFNDLHDKFWYELNHVIDQGEQECDGDLGYIWTELNMYTFENPRHLKYLGEIRPFLDKNYDTQKTGLIPEGLSATFNNALGEIGYCIELLFEDPKFNRETANELFNNAVAQLQTCFGGARELPRSLLKRTRNAL